MLDLPLERIHSSAFDAARAAHCAGEEGKFWEMHDRLFENFRTLKPFEPHAEAVGLDMTKFQSCMSSERYVDAVRQDMVEAGKAGATGTPSFVLALTDPSDLGKVEGLSFIRGAQPYSAFQGAIDAALEDLDTD